MAKFTFCPLLLVIQVSRHSSGCPPHHHSHRDLPHLFLN